MSKAALFLIAQNWKQLKWLSLGEEDNGMSVPTMDYLLFRNKDGYTIDINNMDEFKNQLCWMQEAGQKGTQIVWFHLHKTVENAN